MTINTLFKEGEEIFFIHEAKVISSIVQGFKIERLPQKDGGGYETVITYLCNRDPLKSVNVKVLESIAFKSKAALLKSL